MKKMMAVLLSLTMAFSVSACGGSGQQPASSGSGASAPASSAASSEAGQEPVTLRLAHSHSENEIPHLEMVQMAENIEKRTNGMVKVEVYPSNQLGTNEDLLEQMRVGTNLALYVDPGRLDTYVPGVSAISAPYVIEGYEDIERLKELPLVQDWTKTLEDQFGLTMMSWNWCQGFRNIFATKGGTKPGDFTSLQLRSAPAPIWVETVKALGATPVSLEFNEMYTGIQSKIVDGCEQNYGAIYNNAIYEVITTMTETRHVYLANCVVVSSAWLRALPEEHQTAILEECELGGERTTEKLAEKDAFYLEEMQKAGMQVIPYEDLDIEAFKAKAEEAYRALGLAEPVQKLKESLGKQ